MTHFLFTLWDGAGTLPPELSVARALVERGHRVSVLSDPTAEREALAAGADFRPWREAPHLRSRRAEDDYIRDQEARTPPQLIARLCERLICTPSGLHAAETAEAIERLRPDAVVSSSMLLGPQVAGEAAGLPVTAVIPNIYFLPVPGRPPFGTGWQPARGPLGRARDAAVTALGARSWRAGLDPLNATREQHGLHPLSHVWEQLDHARRVLVLSSRSFDDPSPLPPNVRYVGARLGDPGWVEPWQAPAGDAPLVLVSLSSGAQDQLDVLRRIAAAVGTLPVRAVVTTGHAVDPADVPAPANVQVLRSAPHSQVLAQAAAVVTHGGHGTVLRTLAAGVPALVLPMGRDQLDNAARVVARGAGLRLKPSAKPGAIAAGVRRLLDEPRHREGARRMAERLRAESARDEAADDLEGAPRREAAAA